jgi:AAHS family 4-hydroxybenzoate transporter-like MFS transporter
MTLLLWLAIVSSFMGHHFLTNWLPTVLSDAGYPVSHAVVIGGLFSLGGALGSITFGRAMDRRGLKVVALAFLAACPCVVLIGLASTVEVLVAAVVFLAGFLVLGGQLGLNASSALLYPTFLRSTGAGWGLGVGRVGSILGPVIGGLLIASGMGRPVLFAIASTPLLVCALAIVGLQRTKPIAASTVGTEAPTGPLPVDPVVP